MSSACPLFSQDTLLVPYLSLLSLFPLPISFSISLWQNMGQLSDRARDLSVLLTFSLLKSTWNAQAPIDIKHLQVKQDIQWEKYTCSDQSFVTRPETYIYYESWFHEYWNDACCCPSLTSKNYWFLMMCVSLSVVLKRPAPCLSVRAGLWNLLSAALMEVRIHVHTHNISHMLWHCGYVTLA